MIEGLWTAVFCSGPISGAGIIYLANGYALGGDNQYFYTGTYNFEQQTGALRATLQVTAFIRGAISVFGIPISTFQLELSGTVAAENAVVMGTVLEMPSARIQIHLVKRAEKIKVA